MQGQESLNCFVPVEIKPIDLSDSTVTGVKNATYTGKEITQEPVVSVGSAVLTKGEDYDEVYSDNVNAGTATLTIIGKGGYTGTISVPFTIEKAAQSITVKAADTSFVVGKATTITTTGAKGTVTYASSNTAIATVGKTDGKVTAKGVGTVKITATAAATENYNAATKTVTIRTLPDATSAVTVTNLSSGIKVEWKQVAGATGYYVYRNGTQVSKITGGKTLTFTDTGATGNGTKYDYKVVAYAATGTSPLSKSVTTYYVTALKFSSLKSSAKKKMTVKWKKNTKATGYEIQYSTTKDFSANNKTVTITKAKTVSKVIKKLTSKTTYYVRVRAYKTVSNVKYYSAWSATKSLKVK